MKHKVIGIFIGFLCSFALLATASNGSFWLPDASNNLEPIDNTMNVKVPALVSCDTIDTDASGNFSCGTDATGAGGSPIIFDIGDDGGNDSIDLKEIATTGDTNSIFTEPSADKLLIAVGNNWPTSDLATLATTFTCTDNENEALACPLVFVDGATGAQGAETDGDVTYNPSTGTITAISFSGDGSNLTGVGEAAATSLTISGKCAEDINKGQAVYISGAVGQNKQFSLSDNTVDAKTDVIGLAAESKTSGQTILIRVAGQVDDFNTSSWSDGDTLYLSTSGNMTNTIPTSGTILHTADVEYSHASLGDVLVHIRRLRNKGAPANVDLFTRLGDGAGTYEIEYRNYSNSKVAGIDSTGLMQTLVGIDAIGAVDMDYGSADIIDHSFTTNDCTFIVDGGITVSTGDNITLGTTKWNSADEIDGTKIKDADYGDVVIDAAGDWQVSEATALAANGANCNAGEYALGVDASGAVESCTDATTEINTVVATKDECSEITNCVPSAWDALTDMVLTDNYIYVGDVSNDPVGVAMSNDCTIASNGAITCDHDALDNFVANEHIDWTSDQGATNIHSGNYTDTNTNANTICAGGTTYLDGEGNCDDLSGVYQPLDAQLTDLADGTITGNFVNTANPWADNEVSDTLTSSTCTGNSATVTNATLTTALTVNTGTLTLTANNANTSVLTIGAGASSISGANTGDQDLSGYWDADGDIAADEISEGKINFSTACGAGNHYYLNGNDLACEANTTDTNLTQEEVDDFVNLLLKDADSVNTRITLTYDDTNNAFDFVVDDMNDDVPESGDFGNAGDLDADGTITDGVIDEADLDIANAAVDEYVLTYEADTSNFQWVAMAGGGDITDVFDCSTGDCNTMTVGTSEYLTYGTGYIDANRFLGVTTVDGTEFGYLNGVSSLIQGQIDGKEGTLTNSAGLLAALSDESGTGVAIFGTSPTFTTGITVPADSISHTELSEGDAFVFTGSVALPQGSPTIDGAGEIGVDTSSDQLVYYGGAKRVIPYYKEKGFVLEDPVAADDDVPFWHPHDNITITDCYCETQGGTSAEVIISDGTNVLETITCDADGQADDGSIANGTFTANERMEFDIGTVTGSVDWVAFTITYTIDAD